MNNPQLILKTNEVLKSSLALALDFDDLIVASQLGSKLKDYFGVAKVGLELFSAAGPEAIEDLMNQGYQVFVDLKLFDIPNTVRKAAQVIGGLGEKYLTVHCCGGSEVLEATLEGFLNGASAGGFGEPRLLGVTVLTSDANYQPETVLERLELAISSGLGGVVCSGSDINRVVSRLSDLRTSAHRHVISGVQQPLGEDNFDSRFEIVVPGIRLSGDESGDQKRVIEPKPALDAGATLLVVGRSVTSSKDPIRAAENIWKSLRDGD